MFHLHIPPFKEDLQYNTQYSIKIPTNPSVNLIFQNSI